MDIVGPRYLKGGFRFYSLKNVIDAESHYVQIHPMLGKNVESIPPGIINFWKDFGMPDCL
jgi:hypothetical protein